MGPDGGGTPRRSPAARGGAVPAVPVRRSLSGILAALLAMALAAGWVARCQARAATLAGVYVRAVGPASLPFKAQTLVFQRAALREAGILPIYGTSELYCCGQPFNAGTFYADAPAGFSVFNVGYPLTEDLFFAETFGALGHALRGHAVVVSDSPWFTSAGGIAAATYAHTYSAEIARVFVFDAPVPLPLRRAVARRMLAFPATLAGDPVLQAGLDALARGGWRGDAEYALADPIGRIFAWTSEVQDAFRTVAEIRSLVAPPPKAPAAPSASGTAAASSRAPKAAGSGMAPAGSVPAASRPLRALPGRLWPPARLWAALALGVPSPAQVERQRTRAGIGPAAPVRPAPIPWGADLAKANALAVSQSPTNPFGLDTTAWRRCTDVWPDGPGMCQGALRLYRAGVSNRGGTVYSAPPGFAQQVASCLCWTDLSLEFQVLRAVGSRPLAWLQPLEGHYADYTPYSAADRALIYDRYLAVARAAGVPATTWDTFDTDPHFENSFGHFTPRGWVFADRLLDLLWQGRVGRLSPAGLADGSAVAALFPRALACPAAADCEGLRVTGPPAGENLLRPRPAAAARGTASAGAAARGAPASAGAVPPASRRAVPPAVSLPAPAGAPGVVAAP